MAPHRGREEAAAALKEALVLRFGASLRDVVDREVTARLAGRSRLEREDLDAIENNILAARREQRGGATGGASGGAAPRARRTRSAPDLAASASCAMPATPGAASSNAAAVQVSPPRLAASSPLPPPPPSAGRKSAVRPQLVLGAPIKDPSRSLGSLRPPPFGVDVVRSLEAPDFGRAQLQVNPKYLVPLKPKTKPMDHWDLIVAFDAAKFRAEGREFVNAGKREQHEKFKARLDGQMAEIQAIRDEEQAQRQRDRERMQALMEENRRLSEAEQSKAEEKKAKVREANAQGMGEIEQRRSWEEERKQREQQEMLAWIEAEKKRKEEEVVAERAEYARKVQVARLEMEEAQAERERRKKAQREQDLAVVAEQVRALDDRVAANRAAVQARMDQIERNCRTLGAEIADRDARAERELQEQIKRVQEESDRASKADAERRKAERQRKVREMITTLDRQLKEREEAVVAEKEAGVKQAEIFRQQRDENERRELEKLEKKRQAREQMDLALIDQIRKNASVHPRNFGITELTQQQDLAYNRALYEKMAKDNFREDLTSKMLGQAEFRKLDPFPSVPRYNQPIHPLEMQVPDV